MSILVVEYQIDSETSSTSKEYISRAFDLYSQGEPVINVNYLSDPLYILNQDNGFVVSGDPTQKLINFLDYAENISKSTWGSAVADETYFDSKNPFNDGLTDLLPTFYNITVESGSYTYAQGIGDKDELQLKDIISAQEIEPILDVHFPSGMIKTVRKTYGIDEYTNDYFVPQLVPGHVYNDNTEYYVYANKTTEIFLSGEYVSGTTRFTLSGMPKDISPIFADDYYGTLPNVPSECGLDVISGHAIYHAEEHYPNNDQWADNFHPYSPFYRADDVPLLCINGWRELIGRSKSGYTLLDMDKLPYYDSVENDVVIEGSGMSCVVTYEHNDANYLNYMGTNISPLTSDDDYRTLLTRISGSEPESVELLYDTNQILSPNGSSLVDFPQGTTPRSTLPMTVVVRDQEGVTLSNQDVIVKVERPAHVVSGDIQNSYLESLNTPELVDNTLAALSIPSLSGSIDSQIWLDRYQFTLSGNVIDNYDRLIGYSSYHDNKVEIPTAATIYVEGAGVDHEHTITTDQYGSAHFEVVANKVYEGQNLRISATLNELNDYADITIKPYTETYANYSYAAESSGKWITEIRDKTIPGISVITLENMPIGGSFNIGAFDLSGSITEKMVNQTSYPWSVTSPGPAPYTGTNPYAFSDLAYWENAGTREFAIIDTGIPAGKYVFLYRTAEHGNLFDIGDNYGD